jgi:Acetyl-CoA hydrolase
MNWIRHLTAHSCTAEEAIKAIKPGDHLVYSHAAAAPVTVNNALAAHKEFYRDVSIYHMIFMGNPVHLEPGMEDHFRLRTSFIDGMSRDAVNNGRADFYPCYFHQLPAMFDIKSFPVDVAVVHITPPDNDGFCSFGVSIDYIKAACRNAKIIIAEMNEQMPRTMGPENRIHVTELDYIVQVSHPLAEISPTKIGELERKIARYCSSLIDDGSTLQIGIGGVPDAVISLLDDRKDLGIHTELFTPGIADLVKKGVITGRKKTFHRDKIIFTFLMGNRETYEFAHNNPLLEAYPVDYTNYPFNIARNENMIALNSCIEVDFTGQVASESIGPYTYSGTGGQVDYVQGARLSKGGKSIMAIPSTAAGGKVSRIVPFLKQGATVTTSRNDVDYIITEYGIAHLRGQSLRERAKRLIEIAHPDFREALEQSSFELLRHKT